MHLSYDLAKAIQGMLCYNTITDAEADISASFWPSVVTERLKLGSLTSTCHTRLHATCNARETVKGKVRKEAQAKQ